MKRILERYHRAIVIEIDWPVQGEKIRALFKRELQGLVDKRRIAPPILAPGAYVETLMIECSIGIDLRQVARASRISATART